LLRSFLNQLLSIKPMSWTHRLPLPLDYLGSKPDGFQLPAESLDVLFGAAQDKLSQSLQLMHPSASIHVLEMFRHLSKNAAANLLRENLTPVEVQQTAVAASAFNMFLVLGPCALCTNSSSPRV
jgi:hypothetical protein